MPNHPGTVLLKSFRGLDNKNPPERLGQGFLEEASNIDIDSSGSIRKRPGYTKVLSGTNVHSLYGDDDQLLYVVNGSLTRYNLDGTTDVLRTGLDINAVIDYYRIGDRIYYSSVKDNGVIDRGINRHWGLPIPQGQPILSTSSSPGLLTKGTYQVAITYISNDGRESGARLASDITLTQDNSAILCSYIPTTSTDSTVTNVRIYCTASNGSMLYLVAQVPLGTASYTISNIREGMQPLDTQFIYPAVKGELLQQYNGRLYMSTQNVLWYSEPHAYEWFKLSSNFIQFTGNITNIMPVDDGIFVTADKLYFLEGGGPETFRMREREMYTGAKRTAVKIIGSDIILENIPTGLKWLFSSSKGIVMVGSGGMVFNLTEKNVMLDKASEGAAIFKSHNGINQYLSVLKNPDNQRLHVGDTAVAEVIRNGITIT